MGAVISFLSPPKKEREPVKGFSDRIVNIAIHNFRGILGFLYFVIICYVNFKNDTRSANNLAIMWSTMFVFLFLQPVHVPVMGIMPVFFLPFTGVMSSNHVCDCYYGPGIAFFIIGGWVSFLLNNSGFDRRLILSIMCPDNQVVYTNTALIVRCSMAAFIGSAFSNRLLVTTQILQLITKPLVNLHGVTADKRATEPNYNTLRFIVCNAVSTSSVIGALTIPHSSFGTMALRAIVPKGDYVYNFFDYCIFAIPTCIAMFIGNLIYSVFCIKMCLTAGISTPSSETIRKQLLSEKAKLPKSRTLHENLSILASIIVLASYLIRYGKWWHKLGLDEGLFPKHHVKDALDCTIASFYAIILHIIPRNFEFLRYFSTAPMKKRNLPPNKPVSTILFWKFVDKNTIYSYFTLLGAAVVLRKAIEKTGINLDLFRTYVDGKSICYRMTLWCVVGTVLGNAMSCIGVIVCVLPLILNLGLPDQHLTCLALAAGAQFGFCSPFLYTPPNLVKEVGKVPLKKQAKFGAGSAVVCCVIFSVLLCYYGRTILAAGIEADAPPAEEPGAAAVPPP